MADVVLQQILHTAGKEPLSTTNGALHTQVKGTDGLAPKTLKTDTDGKLIVSHDSGLAKEATLAAINTALDTLNSNVSTEAKLEAVRVLLATTQANASNILLAIQARDWAKDTTLALVKAELESIKANQLSGDQKVQLTGKNVELLTAFNAVAITDTSVKTVLLDLSKYSRVQFVLRSTLNQKVKIGFKALTTAFSSFWDGAKWQVTNPSADWLEFPGDSVEYIINSKARVLDDFIGPQISIMIACDTAPTSGSVSVFVRGWPN